MPMHNCPKCGSPLNPDAKFCLKCGQPITQNVGSSTMKSAAPQPPHPQMPKMPQMPGAPKAFGAPKAPQMPKPGMPKAPQAPSAPRMPQMPQMPAAPGASTGNGDKGFFTNTVRRAANAITRGAIDREVENARRQGASEQGRDMRDQLQQAQQAQRRAEEDAIRAERDAQRQRDRRSMEAVDGVEVVRGRAIWNIQPGEIARKLKESELEEIEKLKGIIIQEGCTAIVFANGELAATISSGAYLFYKTVEEEQAAIKKAIEAAEKELDEKEKRALAEKRQAKPTFMDYGIVGEIGRAAQWVGRLIFGSKKSEKQEKAKKRQIDYARILARVTQAPILSVYIVSNRFIPMTFGGKLLPDGSMEFVPYRIPMGIHDVEIGVSLQMQVNDIFQFVSNYLNDSTNFNTIRLNSILSPIIETRLKQTLRNVNYEATGLPGELVESLKEEIKQTINSQLYGIGCTQVASVTDSNTDFERFRQVERELYNSERELDYMHRTGEFRNRMENEANSQQIQGAKNAEELRYALQQLNRDKLLHDGELEDFVRLFESQRRIKDATTEEEEFEALEDLRKNRLIKQDEMEQIADEIAHKKIPRDQVTEIMRIHSQQSIDTARQQAEWALDDARTDHDYQREDLERRRNWGIEDEANERAWVMEERTYKRGFDRMKQEDDYDFEKMMRRRELEKEDRLTARSEMLEDRQWEAERERQARLDDERAEAMRHQQQMDKLKAMTEMQAALDAQKNQHEENIASIHANEQMNRDNTFANMNAEQIRAAQLAHLSAEAQVAMANSYSGQKEADIVKQTAQEKEAMMQQMLKMQQEATAAQMDAMMRMAGMIKDTATNVSSSVQSSQQQRIDELQESGRRNQDRLDHTQDAAMSHLSQVSTAAASNLNAFNGGIINRTAPSAAPAQAPAPVQAETVEVIECQCYNCGHNITIAPGTPACPDCGAPFEW